MAGMAFQSLRGLEYPPSPSNSTSPGITHLPTTILDAFIPGYSFISRYVLDVFGFDISIVVSILVLGFACTTGFHYLYRHLWASFLTYFTASVAIDAYSTIYDNLLSWAAEQEDLRKVRSLRVQSADYTDDVDDLKGDGKRENGTIFNFNSWAAQVPPRYEPDTGYHWFRHRGHWFKFSREKNRVPGGWMGMMTEEQETVKLTVLGRSTKPIKDLILDTRDRNLSKQMARTTVRRPSPKEQRGRGRQAWTKVAIRPSRPMGTVVLDDQQKSAILTDINDFMDPATCRWYSSRGIPYRRGYLLSGPPGTGKTSLSFALAGVFGLDIYCMSLSGRTLSEEDLILLFNSLPKRCIVLLEDIDSAGVVKQEDSDLPKCQENKVGDEPAGENKEASKQKQDQKSMDNPAAIIAMEVVKAARKASGPPDRSGGGRTGTNTNTGITMSGLLNAIDGVASQEGRVLIMTTNHPEQLDDALVRPGRVDMKVEFTLASKAQMRELFVRMYSVDSREAARVPSNLKQIIPDGRSFANPLEKPASEHNNKQDHEQESSSITSTQPSRPAARLLPPTPPETPSTIAGPQQSHPVATSAVSSLSPPSSTSSTSVPSHPSDPAPGPSLSQQRQTLSELQDLAGIFAQHLPEAIFSPAEIQGFLLMRRKDPWKAIADVAAWRDGEIVKRREKSRDGVNGGQNRKVEHSVGKKEVEEAGEPVEEGGKKKKEKKRRHKSQAKTIPAGNNGTRGESLIIRTRDALEASTERDDRGGRAGGKGKNDEVAPASNGWSTLVDQVKETIRDDGTDDDDGSDVLFQHQDGSGGGVDFDPGSDSDRGLDSGHDSGPDPDSAGSPASEASICSDACTHSDSYDSDHGDSSGDSDGS